MMVTWEESNQCRISKNKKHCFSVKYKNHKYCEFCGECQEFGGFPISEDLLEDSKRKRGGRMSLIWAILSTRIDKEYFKRVIKRWKQDTILGEKE